ncbi:MAG: hypothetical protein ACREDH_01545, partial [Methylocella sp.]
CNRNPARVGNRLGIGFTPVVIKVFHPLFLASPGELNGPLPDTGTPADNPRFDQPLLLTQGP